MMGSGCAANPSYGLRAQRGLRDLVLACSIESSDRLDDSKRKDNALLARSLGIISSPMTCNSFEMQSLFMLVRKSCASVRNDSCMLLGRRTLMTRVGSLSVSADGRFSRSLTRNL